VTVNAVAFVPAAPLLIPAVAGGSAGLDAELRAASLEVVARAVATQPAEVVVVAGVSSPGEWSVDSTWDFGGFGVTRRPFDPRQPLPPSLGIGAWLLDEVGWDGPRRYVGVDGAAAAAATLGEGTRAVVVVADGSACRSERAPGHLDDRAEGFDTAIADLLARGDAAGLAGLSDDLAVELMCGGLPAWRWTVAALADEAVTGAELRKHEAPYGVGYFVALWSFG
jgi:hypothetical protein